MIEDEVYKKMGRDYTKHLAEAMGKTKENLMSEILLHGFDNIDPYHRIMMPRRGRYQVWEGHKLVADRIKHRREARAILKLIEENYDGNT
jgi:hypothetical protein